MAHDLVDYLIQVSHLGGSDLHIAAGTCPMARVHNQLIPLSEEILTPHDCRELVLGALKESQRSRLEQDWELDFAMQVEGIGRYRGTACYASGRIEASFRCISDFIPELLDLGHSPTILKMCEAEHGLILVAGIGGAGKSTTLSSMVQKIARDRSRMILTIEDPIEYVFQHYHGVVRQRQVGTDTQSFAHALRGALRSDADVIVVGELRDLETIRIALTAAESGHLVIGTLHTTNASASISRLLDAFPEDTQDYVSSQLAHSLVGVVCQHLITKADGPGRALATEIMMNSSGVAACIRGRRFSQLPSMIEIGGNEGMHTLDDSLIELLLKNQITLSDALSRARDPQFVKENFQLALQSRKKTWFGRLMGK